MNQRMNKVVETIRSLKKNSLIFLPLFFLGTFLYLTIGFGDLIYRLFWNSYFATNELYVTQLTHHSGGVLRYGAQFVNQLLISPVGGSLLIAALLTVVSGCLTKVCRLNGAFAWVAYLPALFLLSLYTGAGYAIHANVDGAMGMTALGGTLFSLLLFLLFRSFHRNRWGALSVVVLSLLLYPSLGIYAWMALFLMVVEAFLEKRDALLIGGVALVGGWVVTYLSDVVLFSDAMGSGISNTLYPAETMKIRVYQLLALLLLPLVRVLALWEARFDGWRNPALGVGCVVLILAGYLFSYKNNNFYTELRLSRLADSQDWKEMLQVCKKVERPTRTINGYRVMALAYTDQLGNRLFKVKYPLSKSEYGDEESLFEEDLFFYAGFFNNSYRVSMETWQNYGLSFRRLRNLFYCSMLNEEYDLARRYLLQLEQSPAMDDFVKRGYDYLARPQQLLADHPAWEKALQVSSQEDLLFIGGASVARYFMCYTKLPPTCYEYRLLSDLWECNLKVFSYDLRVCASSMEEVPTCVQEAAVMAVAMNVAPPALLQLARVDEMTKQRVRSFLSDWRGDSKDVEKRLQSKYGKTYCYYFACKQAENQTKK